MIVGLFFKQKNQKIQFSFSCYQQTSPLDVTLYAVGYPKAKALAQFVNSKAFFLSPQKIKGCKKSIDFLQPHIFSIQKFFSDFKTFHTFF